MAKYLLRSLVLCLVVWSIVSALRGAALQLVEQHSALRSRADALMIESYEEADPLRSQQLSAEAERIISQIGSYWKADWRYLTLAGLVYAGGMLLAAGYWKSCLNALGQQAPATMIGWAYFYGNLGKYFPGKAMVIVLRLSALSPAGVRRVAATMTIFMETLTMMSVGAAMAALSLILLNTDWRLTLLAAALIAVTLAPTHPALVRHLLTRFQSGVDSETLQRWSKGINYRLIFNGWIILSWTWMAFGLSLGLVLIGLPSTELSEGLGWRFWIASLGACAMAVVLGFVSMIPGGAGVREATLSVILAPIVGPVAAISCAIWLRIVWLAVEIAMATLFYCGRTLFTRDGKLSL